MNLVICGKKCKFQKDGYCNLPNLSQMGNNLGEGCVHFTPLEETKKPL
ncbi:hypothetical protein [Bittarella massiliensis (ex Durand et al. 2017)]|nr:hypothetical protein [Bittarella massiliensis (ex Durand et al. 2017)]